MININKWRLLMQQAANGGGVAPCNDIAYVTSGTLIANTDGNTISITGIQSGDLIILSGASDSGTISTPSGFTEGQSGTAGSVRYGWSYAFSTGTSLNISVSGSTGTSRIAWIYQVFRGVKEATPIHAYTFDSASTGDPDAPSITTTEDGCMILALGMLDDDGVTTVTTPSGFTETQVAYVGVGLNANVSTNMSAYYLQSTAGTIDPSTFTSSGDDNWASFSIALLSDCVEVFVPTQISEIPSLMYWFNPDTIDANATSDGDTVTEWVESVTSTSAPAISAGTNPKMRVINGKRCVSFNEGDAPNAISLSDSDFSNMDAASFLEEGEIVLAIESVETTSNTYYFMWSKWSSSGSIWQLGMNIGNNTTSMEFGLGYSGGSYTTISGSAWGAGDVLSMSWTTSGGTTTVSYYINGTLQGSSSTSVGNSVNNVPLLIGNINDNSTPTNVLNSTSGLQYSLSNFIMFDAPLTSAERNVVLNEI
jgi:hypothetical protein